MAYNLWDMDSANLVGSFATEDEALEEVRAYVREVGAAWPELWALEAVDESGRFTPIARGKDLIARAFGTIPA